MRVERNAFGHHRLDHRAQEEPVRHGAGDVADQDAGAALAAREGAQGGRADRPRERLGDGGVRVGQFGEPALADHGGPRSGRQRDGQAALAEEEIDPVLRHPEPPRLPVSLGRTAGAGNGERVMRIGPSPGI